MRILAISAHQEGSHALPHAPVSSLCALLCPGSLIDLGLKHADSGYWRSSKLQAVAHSLVFAAPPKDNSLSVRFQGRIQLLITNQWLIRHASSPTPRQRSDSRWFLPSDITPHQPRDEEKAWFVVAEGVRPGVYQGRSKAAMYLGPSGEGKLYKWPTQDQANACFVKLHDELRLVYL